MPATPVAAAADRGSTRTRTAPMAAAGSPVRPVPAAARCAADVLAAAGGPTHTGSEPARADPADAPASTATRRGRALVGRLVPAAAPGTVALVPGTASADPAAGHVTFGIRHNRTAGGRTPDEGTARTGTGRWAGTGRGRAGISRAMPGDPAVGTVSGTGIISAASTPA
ncbi:MAG TPA: hypothetical protein VNF47_03975 [Streptosporangiaceae bacterium]|nr:hypothetical protein [Streptosporangiaceae bacterium]